MYCAETRESMVEWVSVSRGVFVCIDCAGIHRRPRDETPIVRSIRLDTWNTSHLEASQWIQITWAPCNKYNNIVAYHHYILCCIIASQY